MLSNMYTCVPLALETVGPIDSIGLDFISDLGSNLALTGDPMESSFQANPSDSLRTSNA